MGRCLATVLCVMVLVTPATAKDDAPIKKAKALAEQGKLDEALQVCAAEMVAAQKKKDILRQQAVCRLLRSREFAPLGRDEQARAEALAMFLAELDPMRASAFCAAGQIGHALLFDATRRGDFSNVAAAASATRKYAKLPTGKHAKAMVNYAAGLELVASGKETEACRPLASALAVAADEGWSYAATHIATELAAAYLAAGAEQEATNALAKAKDALGTSKDRAVFQFWRQMMGTRLDTASDTVKAPFTETAESFGGGSVGAAGGRGGSPSKESKVGAAWKKLSKSKPFVSVELTDDGYSMSAAFDKRYSGDQEFKTGVKHLDHGGVTLAFFDRGVRLALLDLQGNAGQPGEASQPRPFEFFTPLAKGETWGVTKSGTVVVK